MKRKMTAVTMALCVAALLGAGCNSYTKVNYPNELGSYTETVVVPGVGQTELNRKLAVFKAGNPDVAFTYRVKTGQYTATFSGAQSNDERKAMYEAAADLRLAVYDFPLSEEDLMAEMQAGLDAIGKRQTEELASHFYVIALTNPLHGQALAIYGAALGDLGRYEDAIAILTLVKDLDGVPGLLANNVAMKKERDRIKAEEYALWLAEYQRQQEEENQRNWDNLINSMNNLANTLEQAQQRKAAASGAAAAAVEDAKNDRCIRLCNAMDILRSAQVRSSTSYLKAKASGSRHVVMAGKNARSMNSEYDKYLNEYRSLGCPPCY